MFHADFPLINAFFFFPFVTLEKPTTPYEAQQVVTTRRGRPDGPEGLERKNRKKGEEKTTNFSFPNLKIMICSSNPATTRQNKRIKKGKQGRRLPPAV
jgi:hypothetical protein